ncbi:MAG: ribonucleotide reductase subunit alpha [Burkholderiales bacterium]|nr:ribonucleotide reductase subunit alpha [Burkholderiales bacterium]
MTISGFDELLQAARSQAEPQRLLFVFATAEMPEDATPAQRAAFDAGEGGTLTPLMCVDKAPAELASFAELAAEAGGFAQGWDIVFVAALSGSAGREPTSLDAEAPLQRMVDAIKTGRLGGFIPFDGQGETVRFT